MIEERSAPSACGGDLDLLTVVGTGGRDLDLRDNLVSTTSSAFDMCIDLTLLVECSGVKMYIITILNELRSFSMLTCHQQPDTHITCFIFVLNIIIIKIIKIEKILMSHP